MVIRIVVSYVWFNPKHLTMQILEIINKFSWYRIAQSAMNILDRKPINRRHISISFNPSAFFYFIFHLRVCRNLGTSAHIAMYNIIILTLFSICIPFNTCFDLLLRTMNARSSSPISLLASYHPMSYSKKPIGNRKLFIFYTSSISKKYWRKKKQIWLNIFWLETTTINLESVRHMQVMKLKRNYDSSMCYKL